MSLNKLSNQTNTGSEKWMHIRCKDILADELKGDQIIANSVTAVVTTSDIINSDDVINANEIKCEDLIAQNNTFPVKTFFTKYLTDVGFNDPEKNVLVNGIGTTSYLGDDIEGSSTQITSLFEFVFRTNDVYKFRLKRGATVLKEINYQYTGVGDTEMASVIWTIDTRTVGTGSNGRLIIQLDIKSGTQTNGTSAAFPRYLFEEITNDTTLQGDFEFTIQPVTLAASALCTHYQSTITKTHSIQV